MESKEDESEGDSGGSASKPKEVTWALPEGFVLGTEPDMRSIDPWKLKGEIIYMRWKGYGWQLGKIYEIITTATPRLAKKFNFRVVWEDGFENHKLELDKYHSGPTAPYKSWVLLKKEVAAPAAAEE